MNNIDPIAGLVESEIRIHCMSLMARLNAINEEFEAINHGGGDAFTNLVTVSAITIDRRLTQKQLERMELLLTQINTATQDEM